MDRRLVLLLLVAAPVAITAVPALAGQGVVAPSLDRKSVDSALAKAKRALKIARTASAAVKAAREEARNATGQANAAKAAAAGAQIVAGAAKKTADEVKVALESTKTASASAAVSVETESPTFIQLAGGPSVTVTVPESGLIEVWAQATIDGPGGVSLYEDEQQMPGQAEECSFGTGGALFSNIGPPGPSTLGTPAPFALCATEGAPGPVLFQTTAGSHTYELRYGTCGCPEEVIFSNRLLRVGPRL